MVYVVVLNWQGARDTIACVESVLQQKECNFQIVVCDNGSTDDSIEHLRHWSISRQNTLGITEDSLTASDRGEPTKARCLVEYTREQACAGGMSGDAAQVFLIHTGANLGFGGGCNVGIRFALARGDADYVWLLNNDTTVEQGALAALVRRADRPDRPGMVGSMLCYFDRPDLVQSLGGGTYRRWSASTRHIAEGQARQALTASLLQGVEERMAYVVGASMLVSRSFLQAVGLMQEDYFLYFEEIDWAERGRLQDPAFKLGFAADSVVHHKVGASAGTHQRSLSSLRYLTISRLRFVKRFHRAYLPAARLAVLWEGTKAMLKGRADEAKLKWRLAIAVVRL